MSGTNDDNRAGSADSEHSSDSFVQVSKEDAPAAMSEQLVSVADSEPLPEPTGSGIPPIDDREDIYGADEEATSAPTDKGEVPIEECMCVVKAVYMYMYSSGIVEQAKVWSWEGPTFLSGDLMNTVSVSDLILHYREWLLWYDNNSVTMGRNNYTCMYAY